MLFDNIKNISLLSLSTIIARIGSLLLIPLLTSTLSTSEFGSLMVAISMAAFAVLFVINGQNSVIFRRLTIWEKDWSYAVFEKSLVLLSILSLIILFLLLEISHLLFNFEEVFDLPYFLFQLCLLAVGLQVAFDLSTIKWVVNNQFKKLLSVSITRVVVILGLTFIFLQNGSEEYARPIAEISFAALTLIFVLYHYLYKGPRLDSVPKAELLAEIKQSFSYGWTIQLSQISILVLSTFDRIMLNKIVGPEAAGVYSIIMLALVPMFVIQNANSIITATYNKMFKSSPIDLDVFVAKLILIAFASTAIFKLILFEYGELFVELIAGENYLEAAIYLPWAADILFLYFVYLMMTRYFHARGDGGIILLTTAIGAALNIVLNYVFITKFGLGGALAASIISYLVIALISAVLLLRKSALKHCRLMLSMASASVALLLFADYLLFLSL